MKTAVCLALLAVMVAGCGETSGGSGSPLTPPGQIDVGGTNVPEEMLASIDEGGPIVERRLVRRFRFLLNRLGVRCRDSRMRLADYATNAQAILDEEGGVTVSTRDVLEAVLSASVGEDGTTTCRDTFAVYLAVAGEPR